MRLVRENGDTVHKGDVVKHFNTGEDVEVTGWKEPSDAYPSAGRVYVKSVKAIGGSIGYFPSVFKLRWEK